LLLKILDPLQQSDRIFTVNLSGINFINQTYNTNTNYNSYSTVIATYELYKDCVRDYRNHITTFAKGDEVCNIHMEYRRVIDNEYVDCSTTYNMPQMVYSFKIYGICL
jgi:hypothetical protein